METLSTRLRETLDNKGISARELAEAIGVNESSISRALSGKSQPTRTNLQLICKFLHINKEWLLHGTGPKEVDPIEYLPSKEMMRQHYEVFLQKINIVIERLEANGGNVSELKELKEAYDLKETILKELNSL